MNKKLNIREILKRYKVKDLYSPVCGECVFDPSSPGEVIRVKPKKFFGCFDFYADGRYLRAGDICLLFPSRDLYAKHPLDAEKAWKEWIDENTKHAIKTWEDMCNNPVTSPTDIGFVNDFEKLIADYGQNEAVSVKSTLAHFKIRLLIAEAYGGNPTTDDKLKGVYWFIALRRTEIGTKPTGYGDADPIDVYHSMYAERASECIDPIAFHAKEQAKEFISHESNRQLIRDFYMV